MKLILICLSLILIILLTVLYSVINSKKIKEKYANEPNELKTLNYVDHGCTRDFRFLATDDFNVEAYLKAIKPKCNKDHVTCIPELLYTFDTTENTAAITENFIDYTLKRTCLNVRIDIKMTLRNLESQKDCDYLNLVLEDKTIADTLNIAKIYLYNPLFIKFTYNNYTSKAYYLKELSSSQGYTNATKKLTKRIRIDPDTGVIVTYPTQNNSVKADPIITQLVHPKRHHELNFKAIKYSRLFKSGRSFCRRFKNDLNTLVDNNNKNKYKRKHLTNVLGVTLYYLDKNGQMGSILKQGVIKHQFNQGSDISIFEENYGQLYGNSSMVLANDSQYNRIYKYHFMQKIHLMYSNFKLPMFTVNFGINVSKSIKQELFQRPNVLLQVYVDTNNTSSNTSVCNWNNFNSNVYNLMVCLIQVDDKNDNNKHFTISFRTPTSDSANQCEMDRKSILKSSELLPYDVHINVTITFTPYNKFMYLSWTDNRPYLMIKKTSRCSTANSMRNIFIDNENNNTTRKYDLKNIKISYDRTSNIVRGVNSVELGHINYFDKFDDNTYFKSF